MTDFFGPVNIADSSARLRVSDGLIQVAALYQDPELCLCQLNL